MGNPDEFYTTICKSRFDTHDKKMDAVDSKVDALNVTVNNGLVHRVNMMNRLLWLLIGAIVVESVVTRFFG